MQSKTRFATVAALALATSAIAFAQSEEPLLVDIAFEGGTVADYIETINALAGKTNILISPEAADLPVPAMTLYNVDTNAAVYLLKTIRDIRPDGRVRSIEIDRTPASQHNSSMIYSIQASRSFGQPDEPPVTSVLSVAGLLNRGIGTADLLTAIETALQLAGPEGPPTTIKFHEATGLLIARGTPNQIDTIRVVVKEIGVSLEFMQAAERQREAQAALLELTDRIKVLEDQLALATMSLREKDQFIQRLQRAGNRR